MARKRRYSRLSKRENKRYARQTALFTFLTIILLLTLVFWGIPALIKVAIFLGDVRSTSQPLSGKDTIAPTAPVLQPLVDATYSATVRVEGFAEEGSTVILSIDGVDTYETVVESDGEFLFNSVKLSLGENMISARAIDSSGNDSKESREMKIIYDNQAPELTIIDPADGSQYSGSREKTIKINGSTEVGSTVTVNGSFIIISKDGSFSYSFSLSSGDNEIKVIAKDRSGNEALDTRIVHFEE